MCQYPFNFWDHVPLDEVLQLREKLRKGLVVFMMLALLLQPVTASTALGIEDRLQSYLVGDFESGRLLEEYNIDQPVSIASVSKLMTYLVVMDKIQGGSINLTDRVTITPEIEAVGGSNFRLLEGEVLTVDELLTGLMVVSGNDAAYALAVHTAGTEAAFAEMMNAKAQELGLVNSRFYNSSGLQEGANQNTMSTREIFEMSRHIIQAYPQVLEYAAVRVVNMPERNYSAESTIPLVGEVPGVDGLKTGFTEEAGYCLVSTIDARKSAQGGEFRLITIVMGTADLSERRDLSKYLIDYSLEKYGIRTIVDANMPYTQVEINSAQNPTVQVFPAQSYRLLTEKAKRYIFKSEINEGLTAPLTAGDSVGTLRVYADDQEIMTADLIVQEDVPAANLFTRIIRFIETIFSSIGKLL